MSSSPPDNDNYSETDPKRHVFPLAALTTTLSEIKIAEPTKKSKLTSRTLMGIADYIRTEPKKIILMVGAGISTNGKLKIE